MCCVLPYLSFIHSDQALVDLGPVGDSADVPQLIGVLCERTRLHLRRRNNRVTKHVNKTNSFFITFLKILRNISMLGQTR